MASKITLDFGDGSHDFCLRIGELRELQEKTSIGPMKLMQRILDNDWRVDDSREIIRLGLIGAGSTPLDALDLIRKYVDERPIVESIEPALRILSHALMGSPQEQENSPATKKAEAAAETTI